MRVQIIGKGNTASVKNALEHLGATVAEQADLVVLAGVGAADTAERCAVTALVRKRVLGICLGAQLLLDWCEEGDVAGLGLVPGKARKLWGRTPRLGWFPVSGKIAGTFYFVHSYYPDVTDKLATSWTTHEGQLFPAAYERGLLTGVQFHPEKSGEEGLRFLETWLAA